MDDKDLSKYRAEVIEKAINLEWLMNAIISQRYFKLVNINFLFEVLYDEYFSFALRRRILEKIVKDFDKKKWNDLNRTNTIRNYFAHCNQQIFEGPDLPAKGVQGKVLDPRNLDREIDFENLHKEFMLKIGPLEKYLADILLEMGGKLVNSEGKERTKSESVSKRKA